MKTNQSYTYDPDKFAEMYLTQYFAWDPLEGRPPPT
jgi:hypothetical protein